MTDSDNQRLDRIEKLIESNAKSIEAIASSIAQEREEAKKIRDTQRKDRAHVFEWMSRLAAAQADYYEAQSDYLRHVEQIDGLSGNWGDRFILYRSRANVIRPYRRFLEDRRGARLAIGVNLKGRVPKFAD